MSDTPRTDAAEIQSVDEPVVRLGLVDSDFARTLERELADAQKRIAELEANQCEAEPYAWTTNASFTAHGYDGQFHDVPTAFYDVPIYRKAKV